MWIVGKEACVLDKNKIIITIIRIWYGLNRWIDGYLLKVPR